MIIHVWNPCSPFVLCNVGQWSPRFGTPVPLYYCALWGNYHPGVEPLCRFTTVHCRQWSQRYGIPVPFCTAYCGKMITQVWNHCTFLLLCTIDSNHQGVEAHFPFCTEHCRAKITQVWNPCSPLLLCNVGQWSPRCGTPVPKVLLVQPKNIITSC